MKFVLTPLEDAFIVKPEPNIDFRGSFARLWCQQTFQAQGLDAQLTQISLSTNQLKGTIRGLHFQWPPSQEAKLVRCQRGKVFDVIVDMRPDSKTFTQHFAIELNSNSQLALYIPQGFAHGFQTLQDDCELHYMMTDDYQPDLYGGVRFDDPAFSINWPLPVTAIHQRDRTYPDFDAVQYTKQVNSRKENPQ